MQIVAVQDHLRLIVGLRAGEPRVHVQILRPGVVCPELQAFTETVAHVHLQRVVAAVAFGVPEEARAEIGIGAAGARAGNILRALRHGMRNLLKLAAVATPPAEQPLGSEQICVGMVFGIDAQQAVVSERADVGHAQHCIAIQLLLDCEIPFLDGRRLGVGLHALRSEDGAGEQEERRE